MGILYGLNHGESVKGIVFIKGITYFFEIALFSFRMLDIHLQCGKLSQVITHFAYNTSKYFKSTPSQSIHVIICL